LSAKTQLQKVLNFFQRALLDGRHGHKILHFWVTRNASELQVICLRFFNKSTTARSLRTFRPPAIKMSLAYSPAHIFMI
jgi:hypothetical protein